MKAGGMFLATSALQFALIAKTCRFSPSFVVVKIRAQSFLKPHIAFTNDG